VEFSLSQANDSRPANVPHTFYLSIFKSLIAKGIISDMRALPIGGFTGMEECAGSGAFSF
jgi:hypothetical protein